MNVLAMISIRLTCCASLAATSLLVGACNPLAPGAREFVIHIDSIVGPAVIVPSTATELRLYGPIGPDGCHRFKTLRMSRSATSADITVLGEHLTRSGACTAMPVYLRGQTLTLAPPLSDPYTVRVHQRDGSVLTKVLRTQ